MSAPGWNRTFTQFACSQSDQKITTVWRVKRKQKMAPERARNLHLDRQRCPSWNWTGNGQLSTTTPSEALRINTLQEVQRNGNPSLRLDSYPTCVSNEDNAIMMCPVDDILECALRQLAVVTKRKSLLQHAQMEFFWT